MFSSPRQEADGVDGEVELGDGADEHGAVLLRLALPVEHDRHSLLPSEVSLVDPALVSADMSNKGEMINELIINCEM